jgi:pyridoxine 4-dehydrogenase
VSTRGCGTWSWGNRFLFGYDPSQDEELQKAFNDLVAQGCNFFDTGDSYGTGNLNARAEHLLGKFIRECPYDFAEIIVASKAATYPWRISRGAVADAVARSAERLGRPVDLAQIHWSSVRYAPWQERALWDGMADALERGDCKAVGVRLCSLTHGETKSRNDVVEDVQSGITIANPW